MPPSAVALQSTGAAAPQLPGAAVLSTAENVTKPSDLELRLPHALPDLDYGRCRIFSAAKRRRASVLGAAGPLPPSATAYQPRAAPHLSSRTLLGLMRRALPGLCCQAPPRFNGRRRAAATRCRRPLARRSVSRNVGPGVMGSACAAVCRHAFPGSVRWGRPVALCSNTCSG
ncbi:hypothetical protein ACTIVE_9041 [Actinomadura verrucosospora]|uniref:Uncharacterized protein n=1 Tax=Actinomadura verrucosospora TaxID=46165 RepID=A0A7D4A2Y6_ACTVE|nr:hypothetical protein ACTIVE_9041 [Actinomadura verrucosospora]